MFETACWGVAADYGGARDGCDFSSVKYVPAVVCYDRGETLAKKCATYGALTFAAQHASLKDPHTDCAAQGCAFEPYQLNHHGELALFCNDTSYDCWSRPPSSPPPS